MGSEQTNDPRAELRKRFSLWRLLLPMLFGGLAVGALLWNETHRITFQPVAPGAGDHVWVDANGDGRSDDIEFTPQLGGDHRRVSGADQLRDLHLTRYGVLLLVLALLVNMLRDLGYMIRLRILSHGELGWRRVFQITALWEFATALAPAVVGGTTVAVYVIARDGMPVGRSAAIVLVTAMLDELFFLVFAPVVFILVGMDRLFPPELNEAMWGLPIFSLFWIGYAFIAIMKISVFYAVFFRPRAIKFWLVRLFQRRWLRRLRPRIAQVGDDLISASDGFKGRSAAFWTKAIAATWCSWGARFLVLNCIAAAFFPVQGHLLMYARQIVLWVVLLISPTPGASGAAEFAFVGFMGDLLPAGAMLLVVALLWRVITYYLYLLVGVIVLPRWWRRTEK